MSTKPLKGAGMSVRVCYNEIDPWCCGKLRDRIVDGGLPDGQVIEKDIRFLTPEEVAGYDQCHFFAGIGGAGLACRWAGFDRPIWTGGFPCQDISLAGTGKGLDGERSGLWHDWFRLIDAVRPPRLLIENSAGLRTRGIDRICEQLEGISYTCWPIVVGADDVGAPHRRKRCWVVCVADAALRGFRADGGASWRSGHVDQCGESLADAKLCGRRARSGEQGDQEGARSGRDQFEGGCGVIQDDPELTRLEGLRTDAGQSEVSESRYAMPRRWPTRPGQPQHGWEAPRLANSNSRNRRSRSDEQERGQERGVTARWTGEAGGVDDTNRKRKDDGRRKQPKGSGRKTRSADEGRTESGMGRATHGVSGRVAGSDRTHRLKALGNAWVPQVAAAILRAWMKWE